jgi:hypothetical protein
MGQQRRFIAPASLVGCGEVRTASIEALGFMLALVKNETTHTKFSTIFQCNTISFIDAVRASPHIWSPPFLQATLLTN